MASTPDELLALARTLHSPADEVMRRASASRAYYAALHLCMHVADRLPQDRTLGSHERVIRAMSDCRSGGAEYWKAIRRVGIRLNAAKDIRVLADYELAGEFRVSDADEAIRLADGIFAGVADLPSMKL